MSTADPLDIPDRALFKAAEVCDLVKVQPYVLRSWEAEFPGLGVSKTDGGPRVYRRVDVELVARIRHLLLVEGLTLAGVRRKLDAEDAPPPATGEDLDVIVGEHARARLGEIKRGLESILELLGRPHTNGEFQLSAPDATAEHRVVPPPQKARGRARASAARGRDSSSRRGSA
jgi:DNA-binding transcriptional MerR regulator